MTLKLDKPYLDDGIRSTWFFNGRLLSGEDLRQEQDARRAGLQQFGRAIGEGISYGLRVTAPIGGSSTTDPVVTVAPGLAINRLGQALELRRPVQVSLLGGAQEDGSATSGTSGFGACSLPASVYVAGTGVYLLVLAPAEGTEGRAPVSGLGGTNAACNAKQRVEGVRFRLLRLDVSDADLQDTAHLRNRVAHHCFGTTDPKLQATIVHPFGVPPEKYGLLDAHRPHRLTDCDVPLALIHWKDGAGIRFVDLGSVRRRPTRMLDTGRWQSLVGDRRASEAEAMLLQFQEHLEVLGQSAPEQVKATDSFLFLPPAGVLPLGGIQGSVGFSYLKFFEGLTTRQPPIVIEGARLQWLLRMSLQFPPLELSRKELIWLYLVNENQQAMSKPPRPQPYLVFASGYLPFVGAPRYDAAHWQLPPISAALGDRDER